MRQKYWSKALSVSSGEKLNLNLLFIFSRAVFLMGWLLSNWQAISPASTFLF